MEVRSEVTVRICKKKENGEKKRQLMQREVNRNDKKFFDGSEKKS